MTTNEDATNVAESQTTTACATPQQTATTVAAELAAAVEYIEAPIVDDVVELRAQGGDEDAGPTDPLSPAVRRLVRQYDLDVTSIHGTGPAGRVRVSDVIAVLGSRADAGPRPDGAARPAETPRAGDADERAAERRIEERLSAAPYRTAPVRSAARLPAAIAARRVSLPISTTFECDLSRVLAHRERQRPDGPEILLTSYFLVACTEALRAVPEVTDWAAACFGVLLAAADGEVRPLLADTVDDSPLGSLDDRLHAIDSRLRAGVNPDFDSANVLVHHYGPTGSVLATPTPIGDGHAASVGIGAVRRQIVVKEAEDAPHLAAMCHVSLTFDASRLTLERANRFVAQLVRVLDHWPE